MSKILTASVNVDDVTAAQVKALLAESDSIRMESLSHPYTAADIVDMIKQKKIDVLLLNTNSTRSGDLTEDVTRILREIGVPVHIMGHQYLRDAIILLVQNGNGNTSSPPIKELYSILGKSYNATPSNIKNAIRYAINTAFRRGRMDTLDELFGYTINPKKGIPTNSEFISLIADNIRLRRCAN